MKKSSTNSKRRATRGLLSLVLLFLGVALLPAAARSAQGETVDETRVALEQWVETRRILSKEKSDWAIGKELLAERIELMEREIAERRAAIQEAQESIAEADKKRVELIDENERLRLASSSLAEKVSSLEERTRSLLARLPDPIRATVKPLSQRFPEEPGEAKESLSARFQNIVGVLNEVNDFNREVAVTSEVRELEDGAKAEVTALYIGIGQSYYVDATGKRAGVGTANAEGWVWRSRDEIAPHVEKAISILNGEQPAAFVPLPVRVE